MKTAVIITGQMRSFDLCAKNQYWMVYRKLENPDFFISASNDGDAAKADLFKKMFPKRRVHIEKVVQLDLPEPDMALMRHGAYQPSATAQGILKQLWALNRGWDFFQETKKQDYDLIVRIRPDLWFHGFELPKNVQQTQCYSPWWSRWGGICDRLAVMGPTAAMNYFTAYAKLDELFKLGCPLHPESIMAAALEHDEMESRATLRAIFSTVRKDGSVIPPDPQSVDFIDFYANLRG